MADDERDRESSTARGGDSPRRNTLRVKVVHGDFRKHARYPLVFGHYQDDAIVDVEAEIDRHLGGCLTQRHRLGAYPGRLGTAEVVNTAERTALVIGLGVVGELNASGIAEGVRCGVMRHAAELMERADESSRRIGLSFLLIGSKSPRLWVQDSVQGIVRGVLAANRRLRAAEDSRSGRAVQVVEVDLLELYERRAEQAVQAASRLVQPSAGREGCDEPLSVAPHLHAPGGASPSVEPYANTSTWWRRLLVKDEGREGLSYRLLNDSSRIEGRIAGAHRPNVDRCVDAVCSGTRSDPATLATLFHLLLPNALKSAVPAERNLTLVFERGQDQPREGEARPLPPAQYPWELIGPPQGNAVESLGLCAGLVRQLQIDHAPLATPAGGRRVLVIGNPKADLGVDDREGLPSLRGASEEAQAVAEALESADYAVTRLQGADALDVLKALFREEWLVLHVAGHGGYVPGERGQSGVYLNKGLRLTAGEIAQMPVVPAFVFLNCCHAGVVDQATHPGLAATVAEELVRHGVRAVVAAAWVVNDDAAQTFAREFYAAMLEGQPFGQAMLRARQATHRRHDMVNTWAAYQAYGDPDFVLDVSSRTRTRDVPRPAPVSLREFGARLESFVERPEVSRGRDTRNASEEQEELRVLLEAAAPAWATDARARELRGDAWQAVGNLGKAAGEYREALALASGRVTLRALLRLSNLELRRTASMAEPSAFDDVTRALRRVACVLRLQPSREAWIVMASGLKRLALTPGRYSSNRVRALLRRAACAYAKADAISRDDCGPALNRLVIAWLLGEKDDATLERETELLTAQTGAAPRSDGPLPWHRLLPADLALLRWLAHGAPEAGCGDLIDEFKNARSDVALGDFLSAVEQAEWLACVYGVLRGAPPVVSAWADAELDDLTADNRLRDAVRALSAAVESPRGTVPA